VTADEPPPKVDSRQRGIWHSDAWSARRKQRAGWATKYDFATGLHDLGEELDEESDDDDEAPPKRAAKSARKYLASTCPGGEGPRTGMSRCGASFLHAARRRTSSLVNRPCLGAEAGRPVSVR